jgi:hypothetical protein
MRQAFFLVLIVLSGSVLLVGNARVTPAPQPVERKRNGAPSALQLQGVASCASAACHNGNGPRGDKGSEYTTWAAYDPHARAFDVLREERSRRMVREYRQKDVRPEKDPLCLSCHVQPNLETTPKDARFTPTDGVGCESCHGAAEKWRGTHYLDEWRRKTPEEKQALGMANTKDLRARAEMCAGCHVGQGDRDVNHDLIAAGHPRLRFEFGAYLATYPKHWKDDKAGANADFEARAWAIGQVVSADASLQLLRHRATTTGKPWPEFAEYECAACHHGLTKDSDRRKGTREGLRPGDLPWGGWYFAMLPSLARETPGDKGDDLDAAASRLRELMAGRRPDKPKVAAEAEQAHRVLHGWAEKLDGKHFNEKQLWALFDRLSRERESVWGTWDGAAQLYLGLAAVNQGLGDLDPAHRKRAELRDALKELGGELERDFPNKGNSLYHTPTDFRAKEVEKRLKTIRDRLK